MNIKHSNDLKIMCLSDNRAHCARMFSVCARVHVSMHVWYIRVCWFVCVCAGMCVCVYMWYNYMHVSKCGCVCVDYDIREKHCVKKLLFIVGINAKIKPNLFGAE